MKTNYILMGCIAALIGCKPNTDGEKKEIAEAYNIYGDTIAATGITEPRKMQKEYNNMQVGDTAVYTLRAQVTDVCKAKGCWMKLDLEDGSEALVKFKDYGFFVPKNIMGEEVIIKGKAFLNEMPVEERRHYAEDAGKTKEEIAAITEPLITYSFEADGVLIAKQ
ncbi:DUF4920 domain-containing protein [Galbibacter pacificus]|uniref:DUF4920 domain-containing protein n=1 Tax=Galbibacter pacificus TaxID=2996052 RepID=A0ABT6FNV2_9FLAO|nr:DUF4920 domain-containing protein [Galbibacter pacificus]MDG3581467.1 DUF4920 domain-containing protein [Galbibacter pacificus]MDG3584945.1 DUF4920 domain-containing protein [Galbibacter pacificus]